MNAPKRRCLYHWVDLSRLTRGDGKIFAARAPEPPAALSREWWPLSAVCATEDLFKKPGVAETIDLGKMLACTDVNQKA